jgi:putative hydrolase of the HAD superfamily
MGKIKIVSFDADGTLVTPDFSQAVWYEGIPSLFAEKNGLSVSEARRFIESEYQEVGDQRIEWYDIKYWLKHFGLGDCQQQVLERYRHRVSCYPEVNKALSSLSKNYTLIVVSCSTKEFLHYLPASIKGYFKRVFSSVSDYGQIKTPALYRAVCWEMGIAPDEMAHVGDIWEQDFIAARKTGITAFHLDRNNMRKRKSSLSLASLTDLEALLERK